MANSIALFKNYVPMLDEVYKLAALSSVLDGAPELVRAGANANELVIPKMTMSGLADYSRNGGYSAGDVTITNETVACNYDRGRMFQVDNLDNAETAGIAFGRLAGEFIRTKVAPEIDAFRFATYAEASGIGIDPSENKEIDISQQRQNWYNGDRENQRYDNCMPTQVLSRPNTARLDFTLRRTIQARRIRGEEDVFAV